MARLCERPGCAAPAVVAYGMDSGQLLVWLEIVPASGVPARMGVICRRHADAMVVPRGWTLDDRRETRPRLFRVSENLPSQSRSAPRQRRTKPPDALDELPFAIAGSDATGDREQPLTDGAEIAADEVTVGEIRPLGRHDGDETQAVPWRFEFIEGDDLNGVLNPTSPLLSRAFRGERRPE